MAKTKDMSAQTPSLSTVKQDGGEVTIWVLFAAIRPGQLVVSEST